MGYCTSPKELQNRLLVEPYWKEGPQRVIAP